jgi:hypothetical protein
MKKVYLVYIELPYKVYNGRIRYLMYSNYNTFRHEGDIVTGLYGWTNKKKVLKKFLDTRADIFKIKIKEMKDGVYEKYKKDYSEMKIEERMYFINTSDREVYYNVEKKNIPKGIYYDIVSTKFEYIASTINISENMFNFGPANYVMYDYNIFNKNIIDALDVLQYNILYDSYTNPEIDCEEMEDRKIIADECISCCKTYEGNTLITFDINEYATLIYLFEYIFFGI